MIPERRADFVWIHAIGNYADTAVYPQVHRPQGWDTDGDGLPNDWEVRKALDRDHARDGTNDPDGDGYTNLEDYLNWLAAGSPKRTTKGDER